MKTPAATIYPMCGSGHIWTAATTSTACSDEANYQDLGKIPAGSLLIGPPPSNIYYQWDTVEGARYWTGTVTFQIPEDMPSGTYRVHLVVTANDDDTFWEDTTHGNNHTFMHDPIEVVCPKPAAPGNFSESG